MLWMEEGMYLRVEELPGGPRPLPLLSEFSLTTAYRAMGCFICCNIGNGYGVCWAAASSYEQLIRNFSPSEIATMIRLASNNDNSLGRRINILQPCQSRFKATLALIDPASVPSGVKAAYDHFLK